MAVNATPRLKVNLFGEAERLDRLEIDPDLKAIFNEIALKLKLPLHEALCDPFFYYRLGNAKLASIADLKTEIIYSGLRNTQKNQIEVWYSGRKVLKEKIGEIINDMVLFPLFNTQRISVNMDLKNGIYFRQQEIGLIGQFELFAEPFTVDKLQFKYGYVNDEVTIIGINYDGCEFRLKKKDTLQTSLLGFEIAN